MRRRRTASKAATEVAAAAASANRVKRQKLVFLSFLFVGHPVSQLREEQFEVITNATASKKANEEDKQPDLASTPAFSSSSSFVPSNMYAASAMYKKGQKKISILLHRQPNIMQCAPHAHTVPLTAMRQSQLPLRDWSWQEYQRLLPKQTQSSTFTVSSVMRKEKKRRESKKNAWERHL